MFAELVLDAALRFLSVETPKWQRENHCYSCHNNGDAARALYFARRRGYTVTDEALADTSEWLRKPNQWSEIRSAPAGSPALARIQFAAALSEAWRSGMVKDAATLRRAAQDLLPLQAADGSFPVESGGMAGAPATYGTALATHLSRQTLIAADAKRFVREIAKAGEWLAQAQPANLTDAAALLWGQPGRRDCLERLLAGQSKSGGWGPQPNMPAEAFDTALALLALTEAHGSADAIARGRRYLETTQDRDGAWPETTRPPGGISYAERISTAGWATYALLATEPR